MKQYFKKLGLNKRLCAIKIKLGENIILTIKGEIKQMTFDEYWENLFEKIYDQKSGLKLSKLKTNLSKADLTLYRLTCIRGETMVNGIEAYFEQRFEEFENDMNILKEIGFQSLAEKYYNVKKIMFDEKEFTRQNFVKIFDGLLNEEPEYIIMQEKIDKMYSNVIAEIGKLDDYRLEFGIKNGLFTSWD